MSQVREARPQAHVSAIIPTLSVTSGKDCVVEGLVNDVPVSILIDTGAATSVLNKVVWGKARGDNAQLKGVPGRKLVGVEGKPLQLYGSACIQVQLATEKFSVEVVVAETPTADLILGRDFLHNQECTIKMCECNDVLHVRSRGLKLPITKEQTPSMSPSLSVVLQEPVKVPAYSEMEVTGADPGL